MLNKIKWLWGYYRNYKYVLLILVLLTPIQTVFQVAIPRMIDYTIDFFDTGIIPSDWLAGWLVGIGNSFNLEPTITFGLSFIILGLIASVLYLVVQGHRAWMNLRLEWMFRQRTFDDITTKGPDFFNKFRTGDLITRMTDDISENMKLSWFACSGVFRFYEACLMIAFTVTMMAFIDPMLTLWAAGPLPILIIIFFKSSTLLDKRYNHLQGRISNFNDIIEACLTGIRVVKAYVREKAQKKKFEDSATDRWKAEISTIKMQTVIDSMYYYIWQFSIIIILIVGGYFVMNGDLSKGKLASFIFYTVWLVFPMFDIGQFLVKSRQSIILINRLTELEDVKPMVSELEKTADPKNLKGDIVFNGVSFVFDGSGQNIVDDVSLEVKQGETVALVGKVGSGKSWLINLLPRLVAPTSGEITIGGTTISEFGLEDLRKEIGYVPQEPVLFSDTIKNNILMGRENITDDLLNWSLKLSRFDKEVDSFPEKLETFIGTRGMSISGGQKQRLALARALVGKPSILLLDDCTSALDSNTETELWDQLHMLLPDLTAIIVTHRPDTLQRVDNIHVFDEGKLAESGHHNDLIENDGHYARIYKKYLLKESVE